MRHRPAACPCGSVPDVAWVRVALTATVTTPRAATACARCATAGAGQLRWLALGLARGGRWASRRRAGPRRGTGPRLGAGGRVGCRHGSDGRERVGCLRGGAAVGTAHLTTVARRCGDFVSAAERGDSAGGQREDPGRPPGRSSPTRSLARTLWCAIVSGRIWVVLVLPSSGTPCRCRPRQPPSRRSSTAWARVPSEYFVDSSGTQKTSVGSKGACAAARLLRAQSHSSTVSSSQPIAHRISTSNSSVGKALPRKASATAPSGTLRP